QLQYTQGYRTNLAFRAVGSGLPVVFLHGTSANFSVWHTVQEELKSKALTVSLDQRGHGRSDKPDNGYTGMDFAADVVAVLDTMKLDKAILVGHSMGARNAWLTAAYFPDRVVSVVSVDYTPFVESVVLDDLAVRVSGGN